MAEREASGEHDYLLGEAPDADGANDDPDEGSWSDEADAPAPDGAFNAFDSDSWYFQPAPSPWYRTTRSLTAILAAAAATIALVVSAVLLAFRGPSTTVQEVTSVTETAATSASRPADTSARPSPPPPAETSAAAPAAPAPAQTYRPSAPRATKAPEVRTQVTRPPMSVAPPKSGRP